MPSATPAFFGRYQVLEELGTGAMGVVYMCADPRLAGPVAIKVLKESEHMSVQERDQYHARSRHEAEAAGRLNHPCIVQIYDIGPNYIVMEYVEGRAERYQEEILRGQLLVDTSGVHIGQINGLAVAVLGESTFAHPVRITATVRMGEGEIIDIEREVELGGPIHSKGVLILSSFLAARFGWAMPLSLRASLVFEQSYGGVEGDSASSAELYALLSALSDLPIRQGIAVTGSVNQRGEIQAVGGVNEKIEGFFRTCRRLGLTGTQGVVIPWLCRTELMLRKDVVEAIRRRRFHIYPVRSVDEGLATVSKSLKLRKNKNVYSSVIKSL